MMKLLLALLLAVQLFDGAAARGIRKTWQLCWDSCFNCLSSVPFADINETNELQKACLSKASLASHFLCLDLNCDEGDRILALEAHNSTCHESFGKYIPPFSLVSNYSKDDIAQMRRIENGETLEGQKFTTPILPSAYFFKIWFDTLVCFNILFLYKSNHGLGRILCLSILDNPLWPCHDPVLGSRRFPRHS